MRQNQIEQIAKRTQRYWYEDGIWEIGFGIVNLLLGGLYLIVGLLELPDLVLMFGQMIVLIGAFALMGRMVKLFKERITYPRTGFVAYRQPAPSARLKRILTTGLLAMGTAALVGAASNIHLVRNTPALVSSILLAGMLIYFGYRFGLNRMYLIAGLTLLLGITLSVMWFSNTVTIAAFFGGLGVLMSLSGTLVLVNYLRRTIPMDDPTVEEEQGR